MFPNTQNPVRPEPVEPLGRCFAATAALPYEKKGQGFDKLSPNGVELNR
jgi:hypothetical protein